MCADILIQIQNKSLQRYMHIPLHKQVEKKVICNSYVVFLTREREREREREIKIQNVIQFHAWRAATILSFHSTPQQCL